MVSRAGREYRRVTDKERAIGSDGGRYRLQLIRVNIQTAEIIDQLQHKGGIGGTSSKPGAKRYRFQQMDL